MIIPSLMFNCIPETRWADYQELLVHVGVDDMFSYIFFALKDILPAYIPAVSCIAFGLLRAGEKGEAEDYMASSILFMRASF